ncbi:MAG: iron ABC transporter permease [Nevskia sp.]|nr:iron ABC transporter permease [Nevskia sp.]
MKVPFSALRRPLPLCLLLGLAALAAAVVGLGAGPLHVGPGALLGSLGLGAAPDPTLCATVLQLRLPRVVLGLAVGAALAVSGAAMQGIFRNPLADPGLVGVSSGAALGAVAAIVAGAPAGLDGRWFLPLASFAGAALATAVVSGLARVDGVTHSAQMLLVGLAMNAVTGAGIGLLAHLASGPALRALTFWMYGSLGRAGWPEIAVTAPPVLAAALLIPLHARELNALLLGEAEAAHLGVDVERLKRRLVLLVLVAVGGAVALTGVIAFVGLIVPQLIRLWAGPDHRLLLPASALLGGALLTTADTAARTLAPPLELPIGILTALLGGPFFIALLLHLRGRGETW